MLQVVHIKVEGDHPVYLEIRRCLADGLYFDMAGYAWRVYEELSAEYRRLPANTYSFRLETDFSQEPDYQPYKR